ncbi:hypothetical protein [Fischerella thermalis]|uniref:hypothetical protein n=1 Tax=Fischerella thermalis TaxID=372787 RepID=UPI00031601E3|nr:hypothetical protein [Fischerella thermalis]PLZ06923.1 hypothetical protein CBP18_18475 [Fischerella thermalis WC119]PLZ22207.1 hypothetical protein CBP30_06610 [Fischerella thermalis WC157]PLZ25595.1 hypothetical protein CBP29_08130 [Fischerella thermalis WC341]PLZ29783.1 hypothetical protein CBP28_09155 [Fischerella thermalis WC559]PLZ31626.1 hypothetical protein CBP10_11225 [Fischerella thermalis WC558]PLZ36524.1 hypothetical protein CBP27_12025 [Fischerella thermalis WC542]PLZ43260.1 
MLKFNSKIFLTRTEVNQQKALKVRFQPHIPKPVEPDALVNAIATLVNHQVRQHFSEEASKSFLYPINKKKG